MIDDRPWFEVVDNHWTRIKKKHLDLERKGYECTMIRERRIKAPRFAFEFRRPKTQTKPQPVTPEDLGYGAYKK